MLLNFGPRTRVVLRPTKDRSGYDGYGDFAGLTYDPNQANQWCDQNYPVGSPENARCKVASGCINLPFIGQQCAAGLAPWTMAGQAARGLPAPGSVPQTIQIQTYNPSIGTRPSGATAPSGSMQLPLVGELTPTKIAVGALAVGAMVYFASRRR